MRRSPSSTATAHIASGNSLNPSSTHSRGGSVYQYSDEEMLDQVCRGDYDDFQPLIPAPLPPSPGVPLLFPQTRPGFSTSQFQFPFQQEQQVAVPIPKLITPERSPTTSATTGSAYPAGYSSPPAGDVKTYDVNNVYNHDIVPSLNKKNVSWRGVRTRSQRDKERLKEMARVLAANEYCPKVIPVDEARRRRNKSAFVSRNSLRLYADLLVDHFKVIDTQRANHHQVCQQLTLEISQLRNQLSALEENIAQAGDGRANNDAQRFFS